MNCNCTSFFTNFMLMMLMLLSTSALLVNSQLNTIGGVRCTQVLPTEGNSLYYHSEVFATTANPKHVEAFKYYCTNDLIFSTIEDLVSISRDQRVWTIKLSIVIQFSQ